MVTSWLPTHALQNHRSHSRLQQILPLWIHRYSQKLVRNSQCLIKVSLHPQILTFLETNRLQIQRLINRKQRIRITKQSRPLPHDRLPLRPKPPSPSCCQKLADVKHDPLLPNPLTSFLITFKSLQRLVWNTKRNPTHPISLWYRHHIWHLPQNPIHSVQRLLLLLKIHLPDSHQRLSIRTQNQRHRNLNCNHHLRLERPSPASHWVNHR